METPDLSTLSDNIDSTDDLVPSLQVSIGIESGIFKSNYRVFRNLFFFINFVFS